MCACLYEREEKRQRKVVLSMSKGQEPVFKRFKSGSRCFKSHCQKTHVAESRCHAAVKSFTPAVPECHNSTLREQYVHLM